ncbi:cell division protein ZapB [Mergibacter septicus]|uniref:Cell division protein ZapB n=1 Tax=Mergibacter septicus TaxID=221402 RepID=A0A8D4LKZ1_9PAST|nr:cell division protein ZapB [Mergibacter septicus]AWX13882.1 cell division protein ZapB [Mergibacter septicus]AWX15875.1 cell division protein ZapB [Mergibacter septicus]QDJ13354.1 cell division protein ZapB [Mergibacter septicus]QDJ15128.1 cell division protein ZapB [Mergibacter septicus]UTU47448.1 cell division protein ZapB [Mergibacter septicus]
MSLQILDQLESKIKQAVETIQLLQMEIEDLKEQNNALVTEKNELAAKAERQQAESQQFQERLRSLLGQIDEI